jgi:hypothetical protein
MSDRTGMARGRVRPIVYFQNQSGYIILPPEEIGKGLELAKQIYEQRYKHQGWMWCETDGSLSGAARLQKRLQDQALSEARNQRDVSMASYDAAKRRTSERLRLQMQSAACDEWEREFIKLWLELSDEKRKKYEQIFMQRTSYLWALEMNDSTQVTDRMPSQPGEFWRNEAQQKA